MKGSAVTASTVSLSDFESRLVPGRGESRSLSTEWVVQSGTTSKSDLWEALVSLTTHHYGKTDLWGHPEKCFRASLGFTVRTTKTRQRHPLDGPGTFTSVCEQYSLTDPTALIATEPVERYSAKRRDAFHAAALSRLEAVVDAPEVQQVFARAIEAYPVGE